MPRIRTLKPEIVSDAKLASVSRDARLTFVYAITQADDAGLLPGAHRQILGALYPLDDDVTMPILLGWIEELVDAGLVRWRQTRDGVPVLELVQWRKHQRIDNAGRSQLGALLVDPGAAPDSPPAGPDPAAAVRGDSRRTAAKTLPKPREVDSGLSAIRGESPLGPPTTDLGPRTLDQIISTACALSVRANQGLEQHPDTPQRIPRIIATSGRSHAAARTIVEAGVPLAFAERVVYALAKTHRADGEVKSLGYFVPGVLRAWEEEQARVASRTTAPPEDVPANGTRRGAAIVHREASGADPDVWKRAADELEARDREAAAAPSARGTGGADG